MSGMSGDDSGLMIGFSVGLTLGLIIGGVIEWLLDRDHYGGGGGEMSKSTWQIWGAMYLSYVGGAVSGVSHAVWLSTAVGIVSGVFMFWAAIRIGARR